MIGTTMGILLDNQQFMHPVERFYYMRLVAYLKIHYPVGWRSWSITSITATELWGETMSQEIEDQILVALPTAELAPIFNCAPAAMNSVYVKVMIRWLMTWELGRALIVAPTWIYERIHAVDRYAGLALNPLTFGHTMEGDIETAQEIHATCESGSVQGYTGPPIPWGGAVAVLLAINSPEVHAPGIPLPWTWFALEAVVAGAQVPLHMCDPFFDFDA